VVDDNGSAREIFSTLLTSFGFRVDQCGSGQAAMDMIAGRDAGDPYELILLDWHMPVMDGVDVARAIQESETIQQ
jgi:CheY-like chemotaxis protein